MTHEIIHFKPPEKTAFNIFIENFTENAKCRVNLLATVDISMLLGSLKVVYSST